MDEHRMPRGAISRRRFLGGGAVLLGGGLLSGSTLAQQLCALTQGDILGPYYRFGAPFQSRLAGPEEPGERLMITGTLFSSDCRTPVPGALMEIWQANSAGLYDTQKPGNFTDKGDFHLRGCSIPTPRAGTASKPSCRAAIRCRRTCPGWRNTAG